MPPLVATSGQDGLRLLTALRWSARLGPGRPWRLETRSFDEFKGLVPRDKDQLARLIVLLGEARDCDTEERARLALLLHVFLLYRRAKSPPWRRRRWDDRLRSLGWLGRRWDDLLRSLGGRRRRWDDLLQSLGPVLATIRPTAPPVTLWLLAYHRHHLRERKWPLLEQRLAAFAARPPGDEIGMLACWMAARELLKLAVKLAVADRDSARVTQALRHYKLYISGRHAHAVGKGRLSAIVEQDLLELALDYPEFLEVETHERAFIEDWLLARFSWWTALRIELTGRSKLRTGMNWFLLALVLAVASVLTCLQLPWELLWQIRHQSVFHLLVGLVLAGVAALWCFAPRAARAFYPRLFAGAILGWSTVLGELGAHRLFAEHEQPAAEILCKGESHYPSFLLLILVPWFFLYQEAQAAIGGKGPALWRSLSILGWAIALVAFVGNAAAAPLERVVCGASGATCSGAFWLFLYGCVVSLYFTIVVHLVWGDEGMSATLAHAKPEAK
jgi:hypothetical protein